MLEISEQDFKRLKKGILFGPKFQFMLVSVSGSEMRDESLRRVDELLVGEGSLPSTAIRQLVLTASNDSVVPLLTQKLQELNKAGAQVIHLKPESDWLTQKMAAALNIFRETVAHSLDCRLVFWLSEDEVRCLAQNAPDLWSWRAGPYRLTPESD